MKKLWFSYKANLLSFFYKKNFYFSYFLLMFFTIIMGIVFTHLAYGDIPKNTIDKNNSFKNLLTIKRWYVFIESIIFMIFSISIATLFGKDEISNGLVRLEQRFGFKNYQIFWSKQISFLTICLVIFIPFIFVNLIFYFLTNNYFTHYYVYQFFLIYLGWFFIFFIFVYSIMYIGHLFFSKTIVSAILSITMTLLLFTNTVTLGIINIFSGSSPNTNMTNMASYQYNNLRSEVLKDKELCNVLSKTENTFKLNDFNDPNLNKIEDAIAYLCNDANDIAIIKYNKIISDSIGEFKLKLVDSNNKESNIYLAFDSLLSKLSITDDILKSFLQLGRMQELKYNRITDYHFIPFFWNDNVTNNEYWTSKNMEVAFWSSILLVHNETLISSYTNLTIRGTDMSFTGSGCQTYTFKEFTKKQTFNLLLNPFYQFHEMLIGECYDESKNYLITSIESIGIRNDQCLNYKFTFDSNNNVSYVSKIIDTSVIYLLYLFIGIFLIGLSYIKYKKILLN